MATRGKPPLPCMRCRQRPRVQVRGPCGWHSRKLCIDCIVADDEKKEAQKKVPRGAGRNKHKGWRRRRCAVCWRSFFYCSTPVFASMVFRNRLTDESVTLQPGEPVCGACVAHNPGSDKQLKDMPIVKAVSRCNRCSGAGWIPGHAPDHKRTPCPRCGGAGEVKAA